MTTITQAEAAKQIERLLKYAMYHKLLDKLDLIPIRNALLDLFGLNEPYGGELESEILKDPNDILNRLLDYAVSTGLLQDDTVTTRDLLDAKIMGLLMPPQSEVVRKFRQTCHVKSVREATNDFYKLSIASNYIRMDRINKNQYWLAPTDFGELEITINLSKPEKDPKEIALLKTMPQTKANYPKCLLCLDNVGYAGRLDHPARQNHRVIPLDLRGEPWYLQYSPYVYYNEHCIVFHEQHIPMKMSALTFERLLGFIDQIPHYFIGSNADLPIVGGSILNHDHFQGGRHVFPMEKAGAEATFAHPRYASVQAAIVKWPMSVIRLASTNKAELLEVAAELLALWREYSDDGCDIAAYSGEGDSRVPHNTITPIARRNSRGEYELDLVLRNNRTSAEHPDGIFHPHQELHHIKKENIGLIEVMGLAVLPGRLKDELEQIAALLSGGDAQAAAGLAADASHPLHKHAAWIGELIASSGGAALSADAAAEALRREVGAKFARVLTDAGVYKLDAAGRAGFRRFLAHAGFEGQ